MTQYDGRGIQRFSNVSLLESKDDNLGAVVGPLTDSEVEVAVNFLSCKQPNMMDLKKIRMRDKKGHTSELFNLIYNSGCDVK